MDNTTYPAASAADSSSVPMTDSCLFADSGIGATLPLTETEGELSSATAAAVQSPVPVLCFRDMMNQLPPAHRQGLKRLIGHAQRQKNPRLIGTRMAVESVDFLAELEDYDCSGFLLDCLFKRAGFDAATCRRMRLVSSRWRRLVDQFGRTGGPSGSRPGARIGKVAAAAPAGKDVGRRRRRRYRHHRPQTRRATLDSSTSSVENSGVAAAETASSRRSSFSAASTVVHSRTLGDTQLWAVAMDTAASPAPSTSSPAWHVQAPRRASLMAAPVSVSDFSAEVPGGECGSGSSSSGGRVFDAFVEEGKRLVNRQFLRQCPRCRWPARVDPDTRIGRCTRPEAECGFAFCSNCLADDHLYRHCPFLQRTSPVKPPPPPPKPRLSLKKRLHRL